MCYICGSDDIEVDNNPRVGDIIDCNNCNARYTVMLMTKKDPEL